MMAPENDYIEIDTPWFDPEWLAVRLDFPTKVRMLTKRRAT